MPDDTFTTLLNFVSDSRQAQGDVKALTSEMKKAEEQAKKISFSPTKLAPLGDRALFADTNRQLREVETLASSAGIRISEGLKRAFRTGILKESDLEEARLIGERIESIQELQVAENQRNQEAVKASRTRAALYAREASILNKTAADIRQNATILRNQAQQLQQISQIGLGLGVGVVGGIFAFAGKAVRDAKEITGAVTQWRDAQESLAKSGQRIGLVFAQEALPILQRAAEVAEKAAGFVEKHPEIVRAALNTGLVVAGLGAVGTAVSKGIKLYADQQYLSSIPLQLEAGRLQFAAAREQLVAARMRSGLPGGNAPPISGGPATAPGIPGGVLGALSKVTLLATSVVIGAELGLALGNAIAKLIDPEAKNMTLGETLFSGVRAGEAITQQLLIKAEELQKKLSLTDFGDELIGKFYGSLQTTLQSSDTALRNMNDSADDLLNKSRQLGSVTSSPQFESILKAYESYKNNDMELVQRHYAERQQVINDSLKAEARANEEYARSVSRINSQRGKAIADATKSYQEQSRNAEQQFALERANIIRDGGIEIQRIEMESQERLRKLRLDHEDRVSELTAARDALGLAKEMQRYGRETSEETRQTNIEIAQRRQDLALRLRDLADNYQRERVQRFEEYKARLEEIRANAREQLSELSSQHQAELTEIRNNKVQRIKELDIQFAEERKRRYNALIAQIRDLDASLIGEKNLRNKRQAEMIVELDKFLLSYKSKMSGLFAVPAHGRASGGYASYGLYRLGDSSAGGRGKTEYVLGGGVTELAERVLGGRITQEKMAAMLGVFGGGKGNSVVYNDERRIDSRISNTDRQQMIDDSVGAVKTALGLGG